MLILCRYLLVVVFLQFVAITFSQNGQVSCTTDSSEYSSDISSLSRTNQNSTFGGAHTPRGRLHIIVIFAEHNNNYSSGGWPSGQLPNWHDDLLSSQTVNIDGSNDLTHLYYDLSANSPNGPFTLTAEVFPGLIETNSKSISKVFDKIETDYPKPV